MSKKIECLGSYRKTVRRIAGKNTFCPNFNEVTRGFYKRNLPPLECVKMFETLRKQREINV